MAVALLNANTMGYSATGSVSAAMSVTASGSNRCAFIVIAYDNITGLSITGVTYGGQTCTSAGTRSLNSTGFQYCEIWYLVNPPTGSNTLVITGAGGIPDIYYNLIAFTGVNQTTPVRAGSYTSANNQVMSAGGTFSMVVPSNTVDLTMTGINGGSASLTGTNQTADGVANGNGADNGWSDHATTAASSVTHTWSGGASTTIAVVGLSVNGDPSAAPSTSGRASQSPGRNPGRFQPSEQQPTAGFVVGATPDAPFAVRSLGPTSRGGRYVGPGGRPRQWAYVASPSFAQNMAPPAGTVRALGQVPVLTPGVATVSEPAAVLRVIGQAPTLTPGGATRTMPAGTIRLVGAVPVFANVNLVAFPASSVRLLGVAPVLAAGAVSIAEPASTVRLIGQIPVLSNAGTIAVPAGSVRLLGQAPTLTPGAASRAVPAGVVRVLGVAPTFTGGVVTIIVDDRRRRWVGGVRNR